MPRVEPGDFGIGRLFSLIQEAVIAADAQTGRIVLWNPAAEAIFGYTAAEAVGLSIETLVPEHLKAQHRAGLARYAATGHGLFMDSRVPVELPAVRKTGEEISVELTLYRVEDTAVPGRFILALIRDVTERQRVHEVLRYQATHDGLTDLPNRTLLHDRLHQAILRAQRNHEPLALLLMDLDGFKEVNDSLGHHVGDLLLQQVARRLPLSLRGADTVARLGGDEFAVILPTAGQDGARLAAGKLLHALQEAFEVEGHVFRIGASVGGALYPAHGEDAETLLRRADAAMYVAKRARSGYTLYKPGESEYRAADA